MNMMLTIQYVFQIDIEKLKLTGPIVGALTGLQVINQCTSSNPSQKGKNVLIIYLFHRSSQWVSRII